MAQNKIINIQPILLTTTTTTNLLNCAIASLAGPVGMTATQPYLLLKALFIINKTAASAKASFWKGATGANTAGTEFLASGLIIPANSIYPIYPQNARLDSGDFLVGGADTVSALTLNIAAEIGFS